jgi:hypothetical protein
VNSENHKIRGRNHEIDQVLFVWLDFFWIIARVPMPLGQEWKSLFNGKDLAGWKVSEGDNGHWKVMGGVIDYNALSEATKDKNLWTEEEFGDFELETEWRIKEMKGEYPMPTILPNGSCKLGADGKSVTVLRPNADPGIYLRGSSKSQLNIWYWPCGSGKIHGYHTDPQMHASVQAGCTPKVCADKPVGQWNHFDIMVKGDHVKVKLNEKLVIDNAELTGIPAKGSIGLQHHGGMDKKTGQWIPASSLMQFRNIRIRTL